MRKLLATFILLFFISIGAFISGSTKETLAKPEIPERSGVYDDPDHPGIKVRVFVYRARAGNPGKPRPEPTPIPQCIGTTDPGSESVEGLTGWKLPNTWSYRLNTDSVPSSVGGSNLATIAGNSFSEWEGPTGINFVMDGTTKVSRQAYDGINVITWGRTSGSALAVTYTRYYTISGQVVDVDTIMNKQYPWVWSSTPSCAIPGAYDAQNILTHELGHWVGLNDEYTDGFIDNTMYGYGSMGEVKKNTLTDGDISAASLIYP